MSQTPMPWGSRTSLAETHKGVSMPRKTFSKRITSEELTKQILPANIDLMEQFLKDKAIRTSDKTITVYRSNLIMFFTWNLQHNKNKRFTEIRKIEFSNFFSYASTELKLGSSRLNNIRSTLSSFSVFIERFYDDIYPEFRNVILTVIESAPKEVRREKTILTDEQVEDLLDHLSKTDVQEACWLALAICSGARLSELLSFEVDMIDENRTAFGDMFLETTKQIKTKGRGKAGKPLYKYILKDKFMPFFNVWKEEREKILKSKKKSNNSLFLRSDGNPATKTTVKTWSSHFEDFLGVPLYTHALRHYFVTLLSRKNIPYDLIQAIVGWSSSEMIKIYDDSSISEKSFPELENLKDV